MTARWFAVEGGVREYVGLFLNKLIAISHIIVTKKVIGTLCLSKGMKLGSLTGGRIGKG